jgi:uncharacterized protein (TIGR00369 family)
MQATRERLVRWEDPAASLEIVRTSAGIEALRALVEGRAAPPPIAVLMNIRLVEVAEGHAVFEGEPGEEHYNPIGSVHGGFALTIMDSALGCSIHTMLPAGVGYTTSDVQVRFIRGMTKDTGTVRCEGTALHVGRSTAVAEAKLYDRERRLLAVGTTTCAILRG